MSRLDEVKKYGKKFQGRKELLNHLEGKRLTLRQAAKAKCYDCMGYFTDGSTDCKLEECSLYPFMPYREGGPIKTKSRTGPKKAVL